MSSLTRCITLHGQGLSDYEIDELKKAAKVYVGEGYDAKTANINAVKDILSDLDKEYDDIQDQVNKHRGVKPEDTTPYSYEKDGYKVTQIGTGKTGPTTKWKIEIDDNLKAGLNEVKGLVSIGQPGKRYPLKDGTWTGYGSTYPDFMKDQGWSADEVMHALDLAMEGKELGIRQAGMVEAALDDISTRYEKDVDIKALEEYNKKREEVSNDYTEEQIRRTERDAEKDIKEESESLPVTEEEIDRIFGKPEPRKVIGEKGRFLLLHKNGTIYRSEGPTHANALDEYNLSPDDIINVGIVETDGSFTFSDAPSETIYKQVNKPVGYKEQAKEQAEKKSPKGQDTFIKPEEKKFELTPTEPVSDEEKIAWERSQGKIGRGEKTTIRPVIPTEAIPAGTGGKQETLFGPKETKKGETGELFGKKEEPTPPAEEAKAKEPWEMNQKDFIQDSEIAEIPNNEKKGPVPNRFKEGDLMIDAFGYNPYIYQLQYIDPQSIDFNLEGETRQTVLNMSSTQKYIEWAKEGIEPPPITIVKKTNGVELGKMYATNRRRIIAAQEAGLKKIPAFVEIGRHEDIIKQALSEGKLTPERAEELGHFKDYPELQAKQAEEPVKPTDITSSQKIADWVSVQLLEKKNITWQELFNQADKAFEGTQAEGKYTPKDAYDAMELGINKYIAINNTYLDPSVDSLKEATDQVMELKELIKSIPTQSKRTAEMDEFQQFSTPPPFAYAVAWAANIKPSDVVLEPSAGIGNIAIMAKNAGASKVIVNELSDRRLAVLKQLGFDQYFNEDASQINNILSKDIRPTVIVMNPPFSATAGRIQGRRDTMEGARHIEQALARLEPNGRLVAIVGRGMADDMPAFKDWWKKIKDKYAVKVNIRVHGKEFHKYGTYFDNQLIVIDKTDEKDYNMIKGKVDSVEDIIPLIKGVRDGRIPQREREQVEPTGERPIETGQPVPGAREPILPATSEVGGGPGEGGRLTTGRDTGREPGRPAIPVETGKGDEILGVGAQPTERPAGETGAAQPGGGSIGTITQPTEHDLTGIPEGKRPTSELQIESKAKEKEAATGVLTEDLYESYKPERLEIAGAKKHPAKLVQSAAMAAVSSPKPTYKLNLPQKVINEGKLSDAQLEAVVYAGQAHEDLLPDGKRRGYFIGDGTGVGKGREIVGIIWDNWNKGRKKSVWISEKKSLINDAKRDVEGTGWDSKKIFSLPSSVNVPIKTDNGVLFTTYDTLKSGSQDQQSTRTRLNQILEWLGPDFDGVVAFDEAHNMGNAVAVRGERGLKQPALKALAGIDFQRQIPNARVVYISATGATEVINLAYGDRLGLWGEGTAFPNKQEFIDQISSGGIAAMEQTAKDMKAMGLYNARSLSFDGVEQEIIEHKLTQEQRGIYNKLAEAWQLVLRNIDAALETTGAIDENSGRTKNAKAKSAAHSAFWGANLRFFNQILTSMKVPTLIKNMHEDLDRGEAVVIQLTSTLEAAQGRAFARLTDEQSLDDLDLTPRDTIMELVSKSFPVTQYEDYMDDEGNIKSRMVVDSEGNPVLNADAVAMREKLLDELGAIRVPDSPIDMILEEFGTDNIAEVTGRKRRVVRKMTDKGMARVIEKRSDAKCIVDTTAFMDDKKKGLIFSEKGGTGSSYDADKSRLNQRKRNHYILQGGWRADKVTQGMGRDHRANQKQPPNYKLLTTDLKGEKRFISSIARRLDQLGALTKGERKTGSRGLFSAKDNLENDYARDAMRLFYEDLYRERIENLTTGEFEHQTGLKITDPQGGMVQQLPPIRQFLNRILSLNIETQDSLFDAFSERLDRIIQGHIDSGDLDVGLETLRADEVKKVSEETVHTDQRSGAETKYVQLDVTNKSPILKYDDAKRYAKDGFYLNIKSGKIWAATTNTVTNRDTGAIEDVHDLTSTAYYKNRLNANEFTPDRWEKVSGGQVKKLWDEAVEKTPATHTKREHLITGLILPIWDRLHTGHTRIMRIQTNEGERMIGRIIPQSQLASTLKRLGAEAGKVKVTPKEIYQKVLDQGYKVSLANDWDIVRRRVSGEDRIELVGPGYYDLDIIRKYGVFTERIQYNTRYFIPTAEDQGTNAIESIIKNSPVVSVNPPARLQGEPEEIAEPKVPYGKDVFEEGVDKIGESDVQYAYVPTENTQLAFNFTPEERKATGAIPPTQRIRMATTGYIKGAGNIVSGPGDVASLLASIRKSPQELLYTVTVDKDGIILEIHKIYKGGKAASVAYPTEIAGRVLNIKDASKTYLVHNHPSGDTTPSTEDFTVGSEVQKVLLSGNIELQSLVIGKNKYAMFSPSNYPVKKAGYSEESDIPKVLRKVLIPVKERKTLIRSGQGKFINGSVAAEQLFKSEEYGNQDGVLLMGRKNNTIAFVPFIKGQSMKQTTADIVRLAESTNASSFVVNNNSDSENRMTYIDALKTGIADLKPLDIINNGKSMADDGLLRIAEKSGRGFEVRSEDLLSDKPVFLTSDEMDADFARFLNSSKGSTLSKQIVEGVISRFRAKLPNIGEVVVFQSQREITDDVHKRARLKSQQINDIKTGRQKVFGFYDPRTGVTYIVADNMKNRDMVANVLIHEIIGHRGIDAVLPRTERKAIFNQIRNAYADTDMGRKLISDYKLNLKDEADQVTFSKEIIARMAETGENPSLLDKIIAWIKRAIRRAGFNIKFSDAEIRDLLGRSYRYAKEGKGAAEARTEESSYMMAGEKAKEEPFPSTFEQLSAERIHAGEALNIDSEAFKKWFKGSKVVDENGEPLIIYHGGAENISAFDVSKTGTVQRSDWGKGIYLTPSRSGADYYRREALVNNDPEGEKLWNEYEDEAKRLGTSPMMATINLGYGTPEYNQLKEFENRWRTQIVKTREGQGGMVYPVYVKMENPLIYQYVGVTDPFLSETAKGHGHDGIIIVNEPVKGHLSDYIDEIIAFEPTQIKSVRNRGSWDPEDERISFSLEAPTPKVLNPQIQAALNNILGRIEYKETGKDIYKDSKLAIRTEAAALDKGLTEEGFGEAISKYKTKPGFMKDQAEIAIPIIEKNHEDAMKMAFEEIPCINGALPETMYKYLEKKAISEGDFDTLYRLGTSRRPTMDSELGQRIKSLDVKISDSPVEAMQEVNKARVEKIEKTTGKKPNAKQTEEIARLNKELESTRKALDEFIAQEGEKKAKAVIDEIINTKPQPKEKGAKAVTPEAITDKITAVLDEGRDLSDISNYVQELAKYFVSTGINERGALVAAVHNVLKDIIPDITERETMDAISGYGKYKLLDKDDILTQLRDLKGQMQQIAKLEDLQKTGMASKTGMERRTPTDEERRLIKLVEEAKRKYGIEGVDKERKLKSALDSIKTRLTNQIKDLEAQIDSRQQTIKERTGIAYDAEANRLKAKRDELKVAFDKIFGKKKMSEARRISLAVAAVHKSIAEYTRKIAEKDITPMNKRTELHSAELDRLRTEREGLKDQLQGLRDLANPKKTPEQIALQTLKTRLKNETLKLNNKLNALDFEKKEKRVTPLDQEAEKLKDAHEQAKENYNAAVQATGIVTKEEAANIVRLSQITAEARTAWEAKLKENKGNIRKYLKTYPVEKATYGAAKRAFENYVNDLKEENLPIKTLLENRWKEAKTTWKENKAKTFLDLIKDAIITISDNSIAIVASIDNSFLGRQGLHTLETHASKWYPAALKSIPDIYNTMASKQGGKAVRDAVMADAYSRPNYMNESYQIAKLIPKTEEQFPTSLPERIPFIGRVFKASENAFMNSGVRMRIDTFDLVQGIAEDQGVNTADKVWIEETGKVINAITARGNLGRFGQGGILRLLFWAPKMVWGNVEVLTAHFGGATLKDPFARKQARINLLKIVLSTAVIAAICNAIWPKSVETDPRSSDFMHVHKKGTNTHIDITAGAASIITLLARAITFSSKSTVTGKITKLNSGKYGSKTVFDVGIDFLVNKTPPLTRAGIDIAKGRTFKGPKPTFGSTIYNLTTPIGVQNFVQNFYGPDKDGSIAAVVGSVLDEFGVSANTYTPTNSRITAVQRARDIVKSSNLSTQQKNQRLDYYDKKIKDLTARFGK